MKNLTPELIAKAKAAKSAEELLALAKANNVELTEEEAKTYFEQLNANGAVSDDELGAVAGGFLGISCPDNDGEETSVLMHHEGTITGRCTVCGSTDIRMGVNPDGGGSYYCRKCSAPVPSTNVKRSH
jgi:ribosomal protein S27E